MPSNNQRLLEGEVVDADDVTSEYERLSDELRRIAGERDALRAENLRLRQRVNQVDAPAARLRQTLSPLYNALRAIMGEIEVIDPQVDSPAGQPSPASSAPVDSKNAAVWEAWKNRLPAGAGKIIDALMKHGDANTQQLSILTGLHRNSIPRSIYELNKAGLINKNGGRFSLKQL